MKTVNFIIKLFVALAAIAGAVYVAATYGDKIVAWCKKIINCKCCCDCEDGECCCEDGECCCECEDGECCCEEAAQEDPAEEVPAVVEADFEG